MQLQLCEAPLLVASRASSLFNDVRHSEMQLCEVRFSTRSCPAGLKSAPLFFNRNHQARYCCVNSPQQKRDADGDTQKQKDADGDVDADGSLFDRTEELAFLRRLVRSRGRKLLLLAGPRNCGKSAILKQIAKEEKNRVVLVNLRIGDTLTPEGFLQQVQSSLITSDSTGELQEYLKHVVQNAKGAWESLTGQASVGFDHPSGLKAGITFDKRALHVEFQMVFGKFLQEHPERHITLIIDEANLLQAWLMDDVSDRTLQSYLSFFVYLTKESSLANVVLVSSDFFLKFWLNEKIGSDRYVTHIIGDFPEKDARRFFETKLGKPCHNNTWKCVYNVFGGAPLPLQMIAESMLEDDIEWKELTLQLYLQMKEQTGLGLSPDSIDPRAIPPLWTKKEYRAILSEMVQFENGVVPWDHLVSLFSRNILKSLICYNLIQYRTKSFLAKDVAWYDDSWPVLMPLSRLHWLTMRHLVSIKQGKFGWKELMLLAGVNEEDQ